MRFREVTSTDLFVNSALRPLQLVRVTLVNEGPGMVGAERAGGADAGVRVRVDGGGVTTPRPVEVHGLTPGEERTVEVPVAVADALRPGSVRPVTVTAETAAGASRAGAELTVAETGWTMFMVSHFHYDPVWWNTQRAFTEVWYDVPAAEERRPGHVRTALDLVKLHLDAALRDEDYKFVLAEIDYLKPFWDTHPEDRATLRRLIGEGRVELVGGTYNEPSTTLTVPESTIRNAVYGVGYQRDVVGGDPASAWMLDVFGHDPSFPGMMADAGLTSSAWARGPFHQNGPYAPPLRTDLLQFPTEFEWVSPSGRGLLTSYMANHYGPGWELENHQTLEEAVAEAERQFRILAPVAAARAVLLPVGGDHTVPSRWCTEVQRDWAKRYVWPRFVVATPREFFARVREEIGAGRTRLTPQSRDMGPVYTGKDVSCIDLKQAQRAAETALLDAERLATLAAGHGARYPGGALDKAWRQLLFGAHHDGVTGVASDQVYMDLVASWREAYDLAAGVRAKAIDHLATRVDAAPADGWPLLTVNTLSWPRDGVTTVTLPLPEPGVTGLALLDDARQPVPALTEGVRRHPDGSLAEVTLTFIARAVPPLGFRTYRAVPAASLPEGWTEPEQGSVISNGAVIANDTFAVEADPERGGALVRILDKRTGKELLRPGRAGNELVLYEEHAGHAKYGGWSGEGPWHVLPKGPGRSSTGVRADVRAERSDAGNRLVATWTMDDLRVTQETILWDGVDRIDFRTHVDGSIGQDRMLRARFGLDIPGALPVHEVGNAVIGRSFGYPDADSAEHAWTLDNAVHTWVGLGSTAAVALCDPATGAVRSRAAIGVAEIVTPDGREGQEQGERLAGRVRDLVAKLAAQGVTATTTRPDGPRYGLLDVDSNLPDVRIVLGGPEDNAVAAQVLEAADPAYAEWLSGQAGTSGGSGDSGGTRVWVPPTASREETWVPSADVRGARDLPALIVAGEDLAGAVAALADDLADATVAVPQPPAFDRDTTPPLEDYSAAVLHRGTPGCVVTPDGGVSVSLMRSCTGWPAGVWLDGPRRTAPDGSSFALQHWSHTFEYALACGPGDWRAAGFVAAGQGFNHTLLSRPFPRRSDPSASSASASLPPTTSLLQVEPASVVLTALKPRGNPLASGRPGQDLRDGLTLRVYESTGQPAEVTIRSRDGFAAATLADILEQKAGQDRAIVGVREGAITLQIGAAETLTVTARPAHTPASAHTRLGPTTEPAQPVFTRYWLHDKGAAPMGNVPVAVHVHPASVSLAGPAEPPARLRVTVAAGLAPAKGHVRIVVPPELDASLSPVGDPAGVPYDLAAGGHLPVEVSLTVRPGTPGGRFYVAARISDQLGQTLEDVAEVVIGGDTAAEEPLAVTLETTAVTTPPGGRSEISAVLTNRARSEIRAEAQLVSPFGTWEALPVAVTGDTVPPGESVALRFPVEMPATARAGTKAWILLKVMAFGRVLYTEAIPVAVIRR